MDKKIQKRIQKQLDTSHELSDEMVEALHSEDADTDKTSEENFRNWLASRNS